MLGLQATPHKAPQDFVNGRMIHIMKPLYIIIIILLTSIGFAFSFANQRSRCLSELEHTANATTSNLVQHIQRSSDFINLMAEYGSQYFSDDKPSSSPLIAQLSRNNSGSGYSLDSLEMVAVEKQLGNLTGMGPIPTDTEARKNLDLAFSYNPYFAQFYETLPGITYIYYTGKEHFINLYPFLPSKKFAFADSLYHKSFFSSATPDQNPSRKTFWTPVYLDDTGKGLMVSISKPVYDGEKFRGAVSLDFTLSTLSQFLASEYCSFIFNEYGEILEIGRAHV
jgi:hypothetical protein